MNERIKQLASQAYGLCKKINDEGQEVVLTDEWNQKFAELIVRECVQVCNDVDAEYKGEDVLATWCARAIEEHFGVDK